MAGAAAMPGGAGSPLALLLPYDELAWERDRRHDKLVLGRGAHGTVYAGSYRGQPVAIEKEDVKGDEEDEAWMTVIQLHYIAAHPHILHMYGAVIDSDHGMDKDKAKANHYVVMERTAGNLTELLLRSGAEHASADVKMRLQLLANVASALAYLHAERIIHADVKPDNVMLTAPTERAPVPVAKLTNFSSSLGRGTKAVTRVTHRGGRGTLPYMDPTLLDSSASITAASDVYSFGVMAWHVLTGQEPYAELAARPGHGLDVVLPAHVCGPSGKRPPVAALTERGVPPDVVAMVAACWAPAAKDRPTMAEVLHALEVATGKASAGGAAAAVPSAADAARLWSREEAQAAPGATRCTRPLPVPLSPREWLGGANFFDHYAFTVAAGGLFEYYGGGGEGAVLGVTYRHERGLPADALPPPLVVKRLLVAPEGVAAAYGQHVTAGRAMAAATVGAAAAMPVLDGFACWRGAATTAVVYVVMERCRGAVPLRLPLPFSSSAPEPHPTALALIAAARPVLGASLAASPLPLPLPPAAARGVAASLLAVVRAMHAAGGFHVDIHPGNVLLGAAADAAGAPPSVQLIDPLAPHGATSGIPWSTMRLTPFQAPELRAALAEGRAPDRLHGGLDVYAIGALWYWLATGVVPASLRAPAAGSSDAAAAAQLAAAFPELVRMTAEAGPRGVVLRRMLDPRVEERCSAAGAADALEHTPAVAVTWLEGDTLIVSS